MKSNLKIKTILFSLLIAVFALTGCGKEEEEEPSNTDLLTREWSIISVNGETESDDYDSFTLKFENGGNLITKVTQGSASLSQTGTWSWGPNETTLHVFILDEQLIWKLDKLTEDALWIYDEDESFIKLEIKK